MLHGVSALAPIKTGDACSPQFLGQVTKVVPKTKFF